MSQETPNQPPTDPSSSDSSSHQSPPPDRPSGTDSSGTKGDKKGLSALQWVLIVLGGLFVLMAGSCVACGVVFNRAVQQIGADFQDNPTKAAAEMVVRLNPDLEIVSSDDDAGTMTIRNQETGEEVTVDFSEVAEGNFSWSTEEGEMSVRSDEEGITASGPEGEEMRFGSVDLEDLSDWVVLYPDAELQQGGMTSAGADGVGGTLQATTSDGVEEVADFYETELAEAGYAVTVHTSRDAEGLPGVLMSGENSEAGRQLTVVIGRSDDRTTIMLQYSGSTR